MRLLNQEKSFDAIRNRTPVQLSGIELQPGKGRRPNEYWEDDFRDIKDTTK